MQNLFAAFLVILVLAFGNDAQAQSSLMEVTGVAADDVLNVRAGPGASFEDIGDLQPGARVSVVGYDPTGQWAQIQFQNQIAYVAARYLAEPAPFSPTLGSGLGPHVVTGIPADDPDGGLVARGGAGRDFPRLGVLPNGTAVQVIERVGNGRWAMIAFETGVAWVSTSYLEASAQAVQPAPQAPSTPQPTPQPTPTPGPQVASGFPLGLFCRGTEPFWTMEVGADGTVAYVSLINGPAPLTSLTQGTGSSPFSFTAAPYSGVIQTQQCSDGMSDLSYTMSLVLNVPTASGGMETRYGCCNIVPATGPAQCVTDDDCGASEGCVAQTGQCMPFDADQDGFVSPQFGGNDCDDLDPTIFPNAVEVLDGIDNDCDQMIDEAASTEICNDGIDNDGNQMIDYADPACNGDQDGDGFLSHLAGGTDCDDTDPATHPGAVEVVDGVDNDCDGDIDEGQMGGGTGGSGQCTTDADCGASEGCVAQIGQCLPIDADQDGFPSMQFGGLDCNDMNAGVFPGAVEVIDGEDNDCDGVVDETATGGTSSPEQCYDGVDNDLNGLVDFADPACPTDLDGDGFITIFAGGNDCNDNDPTTFPGAVDPIGGPDQNCDGVF